MDLKSRTIKGVKWSGFGQVTANSIDFVVYIVLARILFPEDFGIFAMATVFTGFIATINQLGLEVAIIQRKDLEESHLSSSFWLILIFSIILSLVIIGAAPLAAVHFTNKLVQPVLTVLSLNFVITAAGFIHYTLLQRWVEFHKIALIEISTIFIGGTASIIMALSGLGVWSLVYGWIGQSLIRATLSWVLCNWRPKMLVNWQSFKELFEFSKNVVGWRVLVQLTSNIIHLLIGRNLGEATLGIYSLAYRLSHLPTNKLSVIINQVALPTFSSVQDDIAVIKQLYQKKIKYISLLSFPIFFGLIITAPRFIEVVYGQKWLAAAVPLQILCVMSLVKCIIGYSGIILQAKNHPEIIFRWSILTSVVLTLALLIGLNYGLVEICISLTIATTIVYFILQHITNNLLLLGVSAFLANLLPATFCSVLMSAVILAYESFYGFSFGNANVWGLVIPVLLGVIIYSALFRSLFRALYTEILELLRHTA